MDIVKKLIGIRGTLNRSQGEMADLIGVSQQVYSNIENGRTKNISPKVLNWLQQNGYLQQNEAAQVPFEDFMEAKYLPAYAQAGYLSAYLDKEDDADNELDTILVPREFEKGNYLVIEVSGDSMDDDSKRAICAGDKLLIKELDADLWQSHKIHYRNTVFVLMTKSDGVVVKQIIKHDLEEGIFICHSWNPMFKDFPIHVADVFRLFYVKKIVERRI